MRVRHSSTPGQSRERSEQLCSCFSLRSIKEPQAFISLGYGERAEKYPRMSHARANFNAVCAKPAAHATMLPMKQFSRKKIAALLEQAENLAPTDPEAALAAQMFRSLLEPPKPRDLWREELQGKLGEYAASSLTDDAQAAGLLANDIRKCLASQGLEPPSIN